MNRKVFLYFLIIILPLANLDLIDPILKIVISPNIANSLNISKKNNFITSEEESGDEENERDSKEFENEKIKGYTQYSVFNFSPSINHEWLFWNIFNPYYKSNLVDIITPPPELI